jgi:hypothetical protein
MITGTLPRMRTLDAAHALMKGIDPETSLSKHALRALAISGRIPTCSVGKKRLINVDALLHILATDPASLSVETSEPALAAPLMAVHRLPVRINA